MSQDALIALYSEKLIGLAAALPLFDPISAPDAEVKRRAPLCGSHVTVSLVLKDGRIAEYAQDVKACALGQASAAVFGQHAIGLTYDEVLHLRDDMVDMLTSDGNGPLGRFEDLRYLAAAREFTNRHHSILLVFEATLEAMHLAQKKAGAKAPASGCN